MPPEKQRSVPAAYVTLLRQYPRMVVIAGALALLAALFWRPPEPREWLVAAAGIAAVAVLRFGVVGLSKFSYLDVSIVPVGALTLLGFPSAAILAAAVGTFTGDVLRNKGTYPAAVNAAREVTAALAAAGVLAWVARWALGPGPVAVLTVEGIPAVFAYLLAYSVFIRGLFYFSLALRGKLTAGEWMVLFRYEVIAAALGAMGAVATGIAFAYYGVGFGWLFLVAFVGAAGLFARALVMEAIASEEFRKVMAMETVIAAGMPLEDSLLQIQYLAGRLVEWSWLDIFLVEPDGSLQTYAPAGSPEGPPALEELRRTAIADDRTVHVDDARRDPRVPRVSDARSVVVQPLQYGRSTLGLIQIAHHRPGVYGESEMGLIERFGRQLALALQLDGLVRPMADAAREVDAQLSTLARTVSELRRSSEEVAGSAIEIRQGIAEQGRQTTAGVALTEALAASAGEAAEEATTSSEESHDAGRLARDNRVAVVAAIDRLVELKDFVEGESREIAQLTAASDRVARVVRAIAEIADQTHLLALNAAIEAARAGQHCRGFAVVADEVRKLADSSARAAEQASDLLGGVRQQVEAAGRRMQTGSSRAMGAEQASETALEALDRIVSAAEVVGGATAAIAVRMQAQREELARLREQITEVAAISKRNGEGAGNVAESAREQAEALAGLDTATVALRELSDRLNGYMIRFREIS
ncbi:hypothetical protein BH23GEM4_BH23GEM4_07500 [soil metagenome]